MGENNVIGDSVPPITLDGHRLLSLYRMESITLPLFKYLGGLGAGPHFKRKISSSGLN